jgi:hypothetical protein
MEYPGFFVLLSFSEPTLFKQRNYPLRSHQDILDRGIQRHHVAYAVLIIGPHSIGFHSLEFRADLGSLIIPFAAMHCAAKIICDVLVNRLIIWKRLMIYMRNEVARCAKCRIVSSADR